MEFGMTLSIVIMIVGFVGGMVLAVLIHKSYDESEESKYIPSSEEIVMILYNLRVGASPHEKEIIDYLIDREQENDGDNNKTDEN